jgi:hypothetical protein
MRLSCGRKSGRREIYKFGKLSARPFDEILRERLSK